MLVQRLSEAGDVAVAEDPEAAREEPRPHAVALDLLGGEEADERLGDREARHAPASALTSGSRSPRLGIASAHASRPAT